MGLIWAQLNKFPSHLLSFAEREITSSRSLSAGELTWSTEVSTPGGDGAAAALPHLAGLADGAGLVRGVPVAGSSPGGEGVLVVGHSGTSLPTHFTVYILIVYVLHTQNGVFTHLNFTFYQPTTSLHTYIFRLGILTPFLHGIPALLSTVDTPEVQSLIDRLLLSHFSPSAGISRFWIIEARGVSHRLLILAFRKRFRDCRALR